MHRILVLATLVLGVRVQAGMSSEYIISEKIECSTEYGTGGIPPTPLPTVTYTSPPLLSNLTSTITSEELVRVTASPVTSTETTASTSVVFTWTTTTVPTKVVRSWTSSNLATVTIPRTICTNGVKPTTVTQYSGEYNPVSGQVTTQPSTYAARIACTVQPMTTFAVFTIETTTATSTFTPLSLVRAPTATVTITDTWDPETVYQSTVTSTKTYNWLASTVSVTSMACESTTTTTYAARCAPTNLVGRIDGMGVVLSQRLPQDLVYLANSTFTYSPHEESPYDHDGSMCCQLCMNNSGCAAVSWSPVYASCMLMYNVGTSGEVQCNLTRTYETRGAGTELLIQSGCGSFEQIGTFS